MTTQPRGIAGIHGREPVGAVLTIGTKGEKGAPVERDRLFMKATVPDASGGRPLHPRFTAFNTAAPAARKVINGVIVHADPADCFEFGLKAQKLPRHESHPRGVPTCVGDGERAVRYIGPGKPGADADGFRQIVCPHERCEFRQGDAKACKPWMRFLFRPSWKDGAPLPTPLVKYVSHSWNTVSNFVGFFEYLAAQAKSLGVANPSLYGVTFEMMLTEKTDPSRKSRFPVVTISPTLDVQGFLVAQADARRRLAEPDAPKMIGLRDPEEAAVEVVALDSAEIVPGSQAGLFAPAEHSPHLWKGIITGCDATTNARKIVKGEKGVEFLAPTMKLYMAADNLLGQPAVIEWEPFTNGEKKIVRIEAGEPES